MKKILTLTIVTIFNLFICAPSYADDSITWWAAGDSYSSGEGIKGSGALGSAKERFCAQTKQAYGPRAAKILRSERSISTDLIFTACTGAVTTEMYNSWSAGRPIQRHWAADQGNPSDLDVITLSMGGNDLDFSGIVNSCVKGGMGLTWQSFVGSQHGCTVTREQMTSRIDQYVEGKISPEHGGPFGPNRKQISLSSFYAYVANTHLDDNGILIIAGYPRLFAPSSKWEKWRHGRCSGVPAKDADMLGRAAEDLDSVQRTAVVNARKHIGGNRKIKFVSRLSIFDDKNKYHSVCSPNDEWLNGTWAPLNTGGGRIAHMFHPNSIGHLVSAEVVAGIIDKHLSERSSVKHNPSDTATEASSPEEDQVPKPEAPSITDGTSHQGIGDPFESICYVAWPTAPTYTATTIELTMSCRSAPEAYLFTHVSYPDPNLPITPSTGNVLVRGRIVNQSTSAYGYRVLWVDADLVNLSP